VTGYLFQLRFFDEIAALTGRDMRPGKRGPKKKLWDGEARH
jgi:hypothetical protein